MVVMTMIVVIIVDRDGNADSPHQPAPCPCGLSGSFDMMRPKEDLDHQHAHMCTIHQAFTQDKKGLG